MRDHFSLVSTGWIALAVCAAGVTALAQENKFVAPANALSLEDTGSLEIYRSGYMQIRDSKMELWVLKILPQTTITVEGEAEADYLRPGLSIQFDGEINKKSAIAEPISEIKLLNTKGKPLLGLFPAGEEGDRVRPVRKPQPGAYCIKGKLASYKDGQLTVSIGGRRITGTLSDEVTINFKSDDPNMAMSGDSVKVKAWYFANTKPIAARNIPGKAIAEEITITLAKPLAASRRKTRRK
jgi:hypothetical protein